MLYFQMLIPETNTCHVALYFSLTVMNLQHALCFPRCSHTTAAAFRFTESISQQHGHTETPACVAHYHVDYRSYKVDRSVDWSEKNNR